MRLFQLIFFFAAFGSPATAETIHSGYSALWFDPERSGEGFVLEVLSDDQALLYWFTYDEEGNQRWLQDVGEIVQDENGARIEFAELKVFTGGRFGPNFDPKEAVPDVVGNATMVFTGCDTGSFFYSAFGQSQTSDIVRLTHTMGAVGCWPYNGVPGKPVKAYAGQSGSWYDKAFAHQGYSLQWLSRDQAIITWYTYDAEGNQAWMIGVGNYADGKIVFESLDAPHGAKFGEAFDPADVEHRDWGSLTLTLSCSEGAAHYESTLAEFGIGNFDLTRLTYLKRPACPYVKPKLIDLYDITWTDIPIKGGNPLDPNNIQAESVANDGTVAAHAGNRLAIWRPDAEAWEILDKNIWGAQVLISPDGESVLASGEWEAFDDPDDIGYPLIWSEDSGWRHLPGIIFDEFSLVFGASQDFSKVVGEGAYEGDALRYPWIWSGHTGQRQMPPGEESYYDAAGAVSNSGDIVVGGRLRFVENSTIPRSVGIMWRNGASPHILYDDLGTELGPAYLCNYDCSLIFGHSQAVYDPDHPHVGAAWVRTAAGEVHYLERPPNAYGASAVQPRDVTADGSLLVGGYAAAPVGYGASAFIWTQKTGMVTASTLIDEAGLGDDRWRTMVAISVSADGSKILLNGFFPRSSNGSSRTRAAVLTLSPNTSVK